MLGPQRPLRSQACLSILWAVLGGCLNIFAEYKDNSLRRALRHSPACPSHFWIYYKNSVGTLTNTRG